MRCNGDANQTPYTSLLVERGGLSGNETPLTNVMVKEERDLRAVARRFLAAGGTIEDCLSSVLLAARDEFQCRIAFLSSAQFRVDGCSYEWPVPEDNKHKNGR